VQNTKLIVGILALAAAVALFVFRGSGEEPLPDTDDTRTDWMCRVCKHNFSVTAKGFEEARVAAGGDSPLICQACSKREAYRVGTCPACGTKFFSTDVPDERGVCPKCHPEGLVMPTPTEGDAPPPPKQEDEYVIDEQGKKVIVKSF